MVDYIYKVLRVLEIILSTAFVIFMFVGRDEDYSKVILLSLIFGMVVINVLKIPMEIKMGEPYQHSILGIFTWLLITINVTLQM